MKKWFRLLLVFSFVFTFLTVFSLGAAATDGTDVIRPGILTGNIDFNSGSDILGSPSSSVYCRFVINGSEVYLPQYRSYVTTGQTTGYFNFSFPYTNTGSVSISAYDFMTPTSGTLVLKAQQIYCCNVAFRNQGALTGVSFLNLGGSSPGFHLVLMDSTRFYFYLDRDFALSECYWRISCAPFVYGNNVTGLGFHYLNFQCVTGFTSNSSSSDLIAAINSQTGSITDKIDSQYFVTPSDKADIQGGVSSGAGQVGDKLSALDYASQVSGQIVDLFAVDPAAASLVFPAFKIKVAGIDYNVWSSVTYNFSDIELHFGPLLTAVRFATVVLVYIAFINYLHGVYVSIVYDKPIEEAVE